MYDPKHMCNSTVPAYLLQKISSDVDQFLRQLQGSHDHRHAILALVSH